MNITNALSNIKILESYAREKTFFHKLLPQTKLIICLVYLFSIVACNSYALLKLLLLLPLPIILINIAKLPWHTIYLRLLFILPLPLLAGLSNIIFDTSTQLIFNIAISGGYLSFITLLLKTFLTITMVLFLIGTTTLEKLAKGLAFFHLPNIFISLLLLIYRYIHLLLEETILVYQSYQLRSNSYGIKLQDISKLLAAVLLRSFYKAKEIHLAMLSRCYKGTMPSNHVNHSWQADDVFTICAITLYCLIVHNI